WRPRHLPPFPTRRSSDLRVLRIDRELGHGTGFLVIVPAHPSGDKVGHFHAVVLGGVEDLFITLPPSVIEAVPVSRHTIFREYQRSEEHTSELQSREKPKS